jgi:hypothetical protein
MQLRGRGNVVSITLAGLAVVIATTGTAVAVTATAVNIVGPNSSRAAQVDQGGRLRTDGPNATFNVTAGLVNVSAKILTNPTSATLAVSRVNFHNPADNLDLARPPSFRVSLVKIAVGTDGTCESGSLERFYSFEVVAPGTNVQDTYPAPLVIASITHHLYCIGVYMVPDMVAQSGFVAPDVQLTGFVVSGTYTGAGTLAAPDPGSAKLGVLRTP